MAITFSMCGWDCQHTEFILPSPSWNCERSSTSRPYGRPRRQQGTALRRRSEVVRGVRGACLDKSCPTCSFAPVDPYYWEHWREFYRIKLLKARPTVLCTAGAQESRFFLYMRVDREGRMKPRVAVMQRACVRSAGAAAPCLEKKNKIVEK